jgi:hypothetical protein
VLNPSLYCEVAVLDRPTERYGRAFAAAILAAATLITAANAVPARAAEPSPHERRDEIAPSGPGQGEGAVSGVLGVTNGDG